MYNVSLIAHVRRARQLGICAVVLEGRVQIIWLLVEYLSIQWDAAQFWTHTPDKGYGILDLICVFIQCFVNTKENFVEGWLSIKKKQRRRI